MSNTFDPYHKWLGIPPKDQPPNHYRLLGITLFEADREVIEATANRQMSYLQELSSGAEQIDEAQKLLGEVSRARICLLDAEKKNEYDAQLREELTAANEEFVAEEFSAETATFADGDGPAAEPPAVAEGIPALPGSGPDAEAGGRPLIPLPDGMEAPPHTTAHPRGKKQNLMPLIVLAVVALVLVGGGLAFFMSSQAEKQEQQQLAQVAEEKEMQAEVKTKDQAAAKQKAKEEADRKEKDADHRVKEAEQRAKDAERKLKQAAERKAAEAAKRKAAKRKAEEAAKRKAEEAAERKAEKEAKRKAAEEAKKLADAKKKAEEEAAKNKAAKEAERKAQELRDNPDKLLKSKGFKKKGKKWVFAKEEKLNDYTKQLTDRWKNWKTNPLPQRKAQLEQYNQLLLKTIEVGAMRLAVSENLSQALKDPEVNAALSKLEVKMTELHRNAKALTKLDPKLIKAVPRELPVRGTPGNFYAALIINEQKSVIVHVDKATMDSGDAPDLFILPRESQRRAKLPIEPGGQKKLDSGFSLPLVATTIENMRIGLKRSRVKAYFIPTNDEAGGVPWNAEQTYGGKIGEKAWLKVYAQLQPAEVSHSPAAIAAAREKLDKFAAEKKTNK